MGVEMGESSVRQKSHTSSNKEIQKKINAGWAPRPRDSGKCELGETSLDKLISCTVKL